MQSYLFILFLLLASATAFAQKQLVTQNVQGKILAKKCIACHGEPLLADPLKGIRKKRTAGYIYSLIKNPMRFADENKTAKKVFAKRGLQMPPFTELSKDDIKAILDYLDSLPAAAKK